MTCVINIDAAAKGNPGPAGIGIIIKDESGQVLQEIAEFIGTATNNQAEYRALIRALEAAHALQATELKLFSDSELMVRQFKGIYQVKEPVLRQLLAQAKSLAQGFKLSIEHVSREYNREADRLANQGVKAKEQPEPAAVEKEMPENWEEELAQKEADQVSAGGVVYKKEGGAIKVCLVAKRNNSVWALPKGRVNPGENPLDTARREILEETGHLASVKAKIDEISYHFYWKDNRTLYHKIVHFYLMPLEQENYAVKDAEVEEVRWFSLGEAVRQLTYLNERNVIKSVAKLLQ